MDSILEENSESALNNSVQYYDDNNHVSEIVGPQEVDYDLLELKPFDFEEFKVINEQFIRGEKYINISATAIMFKVFVNILHKITLILQSANSKSGLMLSHIK